MLNHPNDPPPETPLSRFCDSATGCTVDAISNDKGRAKYTSQSSYETFERGNVNGDADAASTYECLALCMGRTVLDYIRPIAADAIPNVGVAHVQSDWPPAIWGWAFHRVIVR